MSSLRISVVTAVYNRADTLPDALCSVSAQDFNGWEHIIQDGGSTDGTQQIIERLDHPAVSVVSESDNGIYDAINRGIARATGDVIGLLHSDDFFTDNSVLSAVAEGFADPEVDGLFGDLDYVAAGDTSRIIRRWRSGAYDPANLRKGWMPPHPTLYLRREVFEKFGLYDTSYQIAADYDAMLRYLVKGRIRLAYIPKVMIKMRVGGESNRSLGRILRKSREDYRAIKSNGVGGLGTLAMKNLSKVRQFF